MTETFHICVMRQDSNDVGLLLVTVRDMQYVSNKKRTLNQPKTTRMVSKTLTIIFARTYKLCFMR